jgi:hypothetical protein
MQPTAQAVGREEKKSQGLKGERVQPKALRRDEPAPPDSRGGCPHMGIAAGCARLYVDKVKSPHFARPKRTRNGAPVLHHLEIKNRIIVSK